MAAITVAKRFRAPHAVVFNAFADASAFADAIPGVIALEFLSHVRAGVGLHVRRIRSTPAGDPGSRVADTEWADIEVSDFEIVECVKNQRVTFINEVRGVVWECVVTITPMPDTTLVTIRSEPRSPVFIAKLVLPIAVFFRRRFIEADLDAVKVYCEQPAAQRGTNRLAGDAPPLAWPA